VFDSFYLTFVTVSNTTGMAGLKMSKDTVVLTLIFIPFIYIIDTQWMSYVKLKYQLYTSNNDKILIF
jgi:hypothetical protein